MNSFLRVVLLTLVMSILSLQGAFGSNLFPLEPPNTSSPRDTFESFVYYTDQLHAEAISVNEDRTLTLEHLQRAERCFDMREVPPTLQQSVRLESVLRLREILDRITLPDMEDIPGRNQVRQNKVKLWRVPHTEIKIGRVAEGPRMGAYLFTPETVARLEGFYNEVKDLPYRSDKGDDYTGFYEQYIYSSGWMVPDGFIKKLPKWMKAGYLGQAVWQWISMITFILLCLLSFILLCLWFRSRRHKGRKFKWGADKVILPGYAMFLCFIIKYITLEQIHITGSVQAFLTVILGFCFTISAALGIILLGNVLMAAVISSSSIKEEALDADVIKLIFRLCSFALVFILFYKIGGYFGIPVTAIFASAGIAGVAVALAARETLANFFGGISIFLDRPFRAGDYIVLSNGERGEVKAVGMRSTRLLTRDDIMITIPNSVITNAKVVNQSMPRPSFRVRIKLGVAYGTDVDQLEEILMELALTNKMVINEPAPRVRFRSFGDSALLFELLCWASRPHDRGRLVHELNKAIYKRLNEENIIIPFPQRDVHIHGGEE